MAQPIDPRQLRPRRRWYGIAVFVAVSSIALGIAAMTASYFWTDSTYPDFQTYSGEKPSFIKMQANRDYGLYVPENASQTCTVQSQTVKPRDEKPLDFTRDGQRWVYVKTVLFPGAGTYSVQCEATTYGFGDPPPFELYERRIEYGVEALLGLPCLGLLACFVIALTTGLRRGRHRMRLQATASTSPRNHAD